MSDLDDLKAAQFIMKECYVDWVWQERVKAAPPVPSKMRAPVFKWQADPKIVSITSKRKKQK